MTAPFNIITFCLGLLISLNVIGQQNDFQIWTGAGISKELNKKFSIAGQLQARFDNNSSALGNHFLELSTKYEVADWYRPSINYRLSQWDEGFGVNQRFDFDQTFRIEAKDERFYARIRLQREFFRGSLDEDNIRFRFRYAHKFNKKFKMYGDAEYFYSWEYEEGFRNWSRQRYTGGLEFEIGKKSEVDVFYRSQFDLNQANPDREYILGIGYKIKLD